MMTWHGARRRFLDSHHPPWSRMMTWQVLDDDALFLVLALLPLPTLLVNVAPSARRLAELCERHFELACRNRSWRPPRRLTDRPNMWRLLLRQRACAVCLGPEAPFPVRRGAGGVAGGPPLFRLCQQCARRDKVQQQVQRHAYEVAAIGDHGKPLYARQFHMPLFGHANGFDSNLEAQVKRTGL
jgi:hypothetical protein